MSTSRSGETIRKSEEALERVMRRQADEAAAASKDMSNEVIHAEPTSVSETSGKVGESPSAGRVKPPRAGAKPMTPRTSPGAMMGFLVQQSDVHKENEELRTKLQAFDGANVAKAFDPKLIVRSDWANRDPRSFSGQAWVDFKNEIQASGGNIQPIKIRPLPKSDAAFHSETATHQIVFGHRRHQACLELGLPVYAISEEIDEQSLFIEMDRENRGRESITPWELGSAYAHALDRCLFPSLRQLATSLGLSPGYVSKCLATVNLPAALINSFASPLDLRFRTAATLKEAMTEDAEGVLERAREVVEQQKQRRESGKPALSYNEVMSMLMPKPERSESSLVMMNNKPAGSIKVASTGKKITLALDTALNKPQQVGLQKVIAAYLASLQAG